MFKKLSPAELKKAIKYLKINSIIVQFTFIAFPLSMYIVYNKIIVSQNPNAIILIIIFLLFILICQIVFRSFVTIYENIIKTNSEIDTNNKKLYDNIINKKNISTYLSEINAGDRLSNKSVQNQLSKSNTVLLAIYFILVLSVGGFLVIVPAVFFTINYLIAKKINIKHNQAIESYERLSNIKDMFIKNMFTNILAIQGANLKNIILNKYTKINSEVNHLKVSSLYLKALIMKYTMVINILNIAFILILGRFLYSLELLSIYHIITCTLLTVWVGRSISQIFLNIDDNKKSNTNNTKDINNKSINNHRNKNGSQTTISAEQASKIIQELEHNEVVFFSYDFNLNLELLRNLLIKKNIRSSYIDSEFNLFYGSIIDNVTFFDSSKNKAAINILSKLNINNIIQKLPYQYNYVITGNNDEAIPYSLKLAIIISRELLDNIDVIILDFNIDETDNYLKKGIIDFCKTNKTKIIIRNSDVDFNKLYVNKEELQPNDITNSNGA